MELVDYMNNIVDHPCPCMPPPPDATTMMVDLALLKCQVDTKD